MKASSVVHDNIKRLDILQMYKETPDVAKTVFTSTYLYKDKIDPTKKYYYTNCDKQDIYTFKKEDVNEIMVYAATYGHINVVKLMLDEGANNYDDVINVAITYNYVDIVNLIKSCIVTV